MLKRIFFDILFVLAAFFAPWWLTACIGVLLLIEFDDFIELLIVAFVFDTLFGISTARLLHFPLALTALATILFFLRRLSITYLFNRHKAF